MNTTQEIALRSSIPPELEQAGVSIETDGNGAYRAISFPDAIHNQFNVLLPNAEAVRSDENWTPSIRAVKLDPERHSYHDSSSKQGERSLNKIGLFSLASVAGLTMKGTTRLPRTQLRENEIGWQAEVAVRRSDGTEQRFTASKVIDLDVLKRKCWAEANQDEAKAKRRWLYEQEHVDSKAETKAIERAIRAALQIPHAFTGEQLAKPFLVVGYNFTPDWSDPETKRAIVAAGLGAQDQVYGRVELPAAAVPDGGVAAPEGAAAAPAATEPEPAPTPAGSAPDLSDEPALEPEPEPAAKETTTFTAPAQAELTPETIAANEAAEVPIPVGRHKGLKLRELLDKGEKGIGWIRWALETFETEPFKSSVWAFARVYVPDVFEEVSTAKAKEAQS
jgi:hypothetical protein